MYEQHENHENPLRCPVKLYEFYLSKVLTFRNSQENYSLAKEDFLPQIFKGKTRRKKGERKKRKIETNKKVQYSSVPIFFLFENQ